MRENSQDMVNDQKDHKLLEEIVQEHKPFILKCASEYSGRYITDADDEWSIALQAFVEAVDQYNQTKGNFLSFAKLVIKRRLFDYFRKNNHFQQEFVVNPQIFQEDVIEEENLEVARSIRSKLSCSPTNDIQLEIQDMNEILKGYGFTFYDLTECSPKARKTKEICEDIIIYILEHRELVQELKVNRRLPMKQLVKEGKYNQKLMEKYRRYLIAVVEIVMGDYPLLKDYTQNIKRKIRL